MRGLRACLGVLVVSSTARGDYVLTQRLTLPGGAEREQRLFLARGAARLVCGHETTIVRLDKGIMWKLDTILKTYDERAYMLRAAEWRRVNREILKALEGAPDGARKAEMIDSLTSGPEKWEYVRAIRDEGLRKSLAAKYGIPDRKPVVEIREKGEKKTVAGFECEEVRVLSDGALFYRAWVSRRLKLDRRLFDFLEQARVVPRELAERMKKAGAFPLEFETHLPRGGGVERTVTVSVEEKRIPREEFELPKRYRKSRRTEWGL